VLPANITLQLDLRFAPATERGRWQAYHSLLKMQATPDAIISAAAKNHCQSFARSCISVRSPPAILLANMIDPPVAIDSHPTNSSAFFFISYVPKLFCGFCHGGVNLIANLGGFNNKRGCERRSKDHKVTLNYGRASHRLRLNKQLLGALSHCHLYNSGVAHPDAWVIQAYLPVADTEAAGDGFEYQAVSSAFWAAVRVPICQKWAVA
jgi:hypothetical protein